VWLDSYDGVLCRQSWFSVGIKILPLLLHPRQKSCIIGTPNIVLFLGGDPL